MKNKSLVTWGVAAALVVIILFLLMSGVGAKKATFEIVDRCGPIVNLISHTIQNDAVCKVRCSDQCKAEDMSYDSHEFVEQERGCHDCTCHCKKGLFGG